MAQSGLDGTGDTLSNQRILIIDDDAIYCETIKLMLMASGIRHVEVASEGRQAADKMNNHAAFDVVVLDLRMPDWDGIKFLRKAREIGYAGDIIIASGEPEEVVYSAERLASLYELNCIATLRKPVDPRSLVGLLALRNKDKRAQSTEHDYVEPKLAKVLYQPRMDLKSGICIGAEALSRFASKDGVPIAPDIAIMAAETHGQITALTWEIIQTTLTDCREMRAQLGYIPMISINVSADTVQEERFVDDLAKVVDASSVPRGNLIFELTETRLTTDITMALESLTRLRLMGFGLAIDDFGTGHANIDQLRMYPFTELKIDKQFVIGAERDRFSKTCVESAVAMSRELGMKVVAEGVETKYAVQLLKDLDVDYAQGFLYERPVPIEQFIIYARRYG